MLPPSLRSMSNNTSILFVLTCTILTTLTSAHTILTYPGWRGDNLHTIGTIGIDDDTTGNFPYGMQWSYPCGGMPLTTNRTKWPTTGGALAFQSGWQTGHKTALIYVNMGVGTIPQNYSQIMVPVFQVVLPSNEQDLNANVCLPQVPLPAGVSVRSGDNATIQLVETAQHGAALYNCVDITFTDNMSEVATVNASNCFNSSEVNFASVFSTVSLTARSAAVGRSVILPLRTLLLGTAAVGVYLLLSGVGL